MKKKVLLSIGFIQLLLIPVSVFSQSANETFQSTSEPNIFKNDRGATIEYLGMREWTAKEIQDSLKSLAPDRPVHACMAVLKKNLGFAESMVMGYFNGDTNLLYTVVTVVEDRDKLNPIPVPENEKPIIEKWTEKHDLDKRKNQNLLSNGLQFFGKRNDGSLILDTGKIKKSSFYSEEDFRFLTEFYSHIKNQNTNQDRELVHKTIRDDGNVLNQILASIVLLNFDNTKSEMYKMLRQMRSKNMQISSFAATALSIMTQNVSSVDWSGATESIRALIAGTNLHNLGTTLEILTKTNISPSSADQMLTGNTFLLEERLKAKHEKTRNETLAFVNQMSKTKLTSAAEALKWLSQF